MRIRASESSSSASISSPTFDLLHFLVSGVHMFINPLLTIATANRDSIKPGTFVTGWVVFSYVFRDFLWKVQSAWVRITREH